MPEIVILRLNNLLYLLELELRAFLFVIFSLISINASAFEVYGAIRNTGSGFKVINDSEHKPLNICNLVTTDKFVSFDYCGNKASYVQTLLITPDETYASRGITAGTSVGLDRAVIEFGNGKPVNPKNLVEPLGNFWIYGKLKK